MTHSGKFPLYDFIDFLFTSQVFHTHPAETLKILSALDQNIISQKAESTYFNCADLGNLAESIAILSYAETHNLTPTGAYNEMTEAGVI